MPWLIAVAAAGLGAAIGGVAGFFIGGLLGYVVGRELNIRKRLRELKETQNRLHQLQVWATEMKAWSEQPTPGCRASRTPKSPWIPSPAPTPPQTPTVSLECLPGLNRFPGRSPPNRRRQRAWTSPPALRPLPPIPRPGHPTRPAPPQPNPHQPNPHQPNPHQPNPNQPNPNQPNPHQPNPNQPNPNQPNPHQPNPHQPNPNQPNPHQPNPHQPNPQPPNPNQPNPHQPAPRRPGLRNRLARGRSRVMV